MSEVLELEKHHEKAKKKKSQQNKKRPSKKYVVAGKANDSHQSYPTSMIPTLLKISDGSLDAAKKQLANMQIGQHKPHILDGDFIKCSLTLCRNQKENSEFFLKQYELWKKETLTDIELTQIEQIEHFSQELDNTNKELVKILEKCKNHTIDKILEKDDLELALEFLTDELQLPK
ncbi:MAG: hypothetical protein AB8B66_04175 [Rickettsiaceae bacterium]